MATPMNTYDVRRGADLGRAVAEARRARGMTQTDLARDLDVHRAYLAAIEGGRSNRLIDHLLRALRRLGAEITITWPDETRQVDLDGPHPDRQATDRHTST